MVVKNLFERVEGYAKENFITEILAYTLMDYPIIKKNILKLFFRDLEKPGVLKKFSNSEIETQAHYPKGSIIDLEIFSRRTNKEKLLIEIKVDSEEGENQVQRYLDLNAGWVIYLTPSGHDLPKVSRNKKKFLGHFFWEDIYSILNRFNTHKKDRVITNFLKYLEANNMARSTPLTKKEIKIGAHSFEFLKKAEEILDKVKSKVEPQWVDAFGENNGQKGITPHLKEGWIDWWFRTKKWKRKFWLDLCILNIPNKNKKEVKYGFSFGTDYQEFSKKLGSDETVIKKLKVLEGKGWRKSDRYKKWEYIKLFSLKTGSIEKITKNLIKETEKATKNLTCKDVQLIKLIERRLKS